MRVFIKISQKLIHETKSKGTVFNNSWLEQISKEITIEWQCLERGNAAMRKGSSKSRSRSVHRLQTRYSRLQTLISAQVFKERKLQRKIMTVIMVVPFWQFQFTSKGKFVSVSFWRKLRKIGPLISWYSDRIKYLVIIDHRVWRSYTHCQLKITRNELMNYQRVTENSEEQINELLCT